MRACVRTKQTKARHNPQSYLRQRDTLCPEFMAQKVELTGQPDTDYSTTTHAMAGLIQGLLASRLQYSVLNACCRALTSGLHVCSELPLLNRPPSCTMLLDVSCSRPMAELGTAAPLSTFSCSNHHQHGCACHSISPSQWHPLMQFHFHAPYFRHVCHSAPGKDR